jgi:integrase
MKKHPDKYLNAVRIKNANPGRHADGNGLYLQVDDSGAKRWVLRTVIKGQRRNIGLGSLKLISLNEAREEAARLRRMARKGGDPLFELRQEKRIVPTFEEAAREVHAEYAKNFKPRHANRWIKTLEDYAFPIFGNRPIDSIESGDILKVLTPIWSSMADTAGRVKQRMQTVFQYSKAKGWRSGDSQVDDIGTVLPKHKRNSVEHLSALPYAEVPAFLEKLRETDAAKVVKLGFEFLILTAARTSEVLLATWQEIDFDSKTWIVPADHMKMKLEHKVPLSGRCIEILRAAKELNGEYIFPGRSAGKPLSNMAFLMALRRMERGDITAHGFRSSFRNWAEEKTNTQRSVVEAALAHQVENKVEAAYLRTTLFEKRRVLMDRWAAFATQKPAEKVVKMREA